MAEGKIESTIKTQEKSLIPRSLTTTNLSTNHTLSAGTNIKLMKKSMEQTSFRLGGSILTRSVGTRLYASPEQLASSIYSYKTDIYSLGIILLRLLTPTYTQMETLKFIEKIRTGTFRDTFKDYFTDCASVLIQTMAEDSANRPSLDEVERCLVAQEMKLFQELSITRDHWCYKVFLENNRFAIGIHTNLLAASISMEPDTSCKACLLMLQSRDVLVMMEGEIKSRLSITLDEYALVLHPKKRLAGLKSNMRVDITVSFSSRADLDAFESWGAAAGCLVY